MEPFDKDPAANSECPDGCRYAPFGPERCDHKHCASDGCVIRADEPGSYEHSVECPSCGLLVSENCIEEPYSGANPHCKPCAENMIEAEYLKTRSGATGAKQLLSDFLAEIANCNDAAYLQRELSTLGSLGPLIGSVKLEIKSRLAVLAEKQVFSDFFRELGAA